MVLRYYAGLDEAAMAAAMGVGPATVRTHLYRAMQALTRVLEPPQ